MMKPQDARAASGVVRGAARFCLVLGLFWCAPVFASALPDVPPAGADAPNVLLILAEDIGPELACYPENWAAGLVRTPNVDRLAREGVRYTGCFTTSPVCSPSRSALMTGMYQTSIGAHNHRTWPWNRKPLPEGVYPITHYFRAAGYYTANVSPESKPRDPVTGKRLTTGARGSGKTDFNFQIEDAFDGRDWSFCREGQPFFAQLTIQESHKGIGWEAARRDSVRVPHPASPDAIPVPPYYPDHEIVRDEMSNYLDAIMLMDSYVGDVLARLRDERLLDSTIIVFMGDNGQCLARGKQFLYEQGIHVPLIIRWPDGRRAGEVDDQLISSIDVSAALLGLAGIRPLAAMQGRDFLAPEAEPREYVISARDRMDITTDRMRAVRTKRWKYIRNYMPALPYMQYNAYKVRSYPTWRLILAMKASGMLTPQTALFAADRKPIEELYDLEDDPHEIRNRADDPELAGVLQELRATLDRWVVESGDQGHVMEDPLDIHRGYWGHLPNEVPGERPNYEQ